MRIDEPHFSITRQTTGSIPRLPFRVIKEKILGASYELSLVLATTKTSGHLHKKYQGIAGPANTLAFPLDTSHGELFLHLATIRRQAHEYGRTYHEHLVFIYIHGLLHLKGYEHGTTMEALEQKFYSHFVKQI